MEITDEFVELVTAAHAYATARQDELRRDFALGSWARWDWDQDTGKLVFSDAHGVPRVVADVRFAGSVSTESKTWLWSWANPYMERALTDDVREVRLLGEARGIAQLTTAKWPASETDGWEMTSITAYVLQAKGVYRTPVDTGFTYMVMTTIRWADDESPPPMSGGPR
jgi:hypothetical protein